jgi:hypothetical protein
MTRARTATVTAPAELAAPALQLLQGFMTLEPSQNKKLAARTASLMQTLKAAVAAGDNAGALAAARRLGLLRPIYATYRGVGQATTHGGTCPPSCAYIDPARPHGAICYAVANNVGIWQRRAKTESFNIVVESASRPADAIMRHCVSGEPDADYLRQMADAARRFPGQSHFSYMHGLDNVSAEERASWPDNMCVSQSCDTATDVGRALAAGLDAVIVAMPIEWTRLIDRGGSKVITVAAPDGSPLEARVVACPEQRPEKSVNCATCQHLCRTPGRRDPAGRPLVVAFDAHTATRMVKAATLQRRAAVDGRLDIVTA